MIGRLEGRFPIITLLKNWYNMRMDINRKNPDKWNADIQASVAFYNRWFVEFAPPAFRTSREQSAKRVDIAVQKLNSMCDLDDDVLISSPTILPVLRQMTCPPLACDRLAGLAYVRPSVVKSFEEGTARMPTRIKYAPQIMDVIRDLLDVDLFSWIDGAKSPTEEQRKLAAFVISDRLCGALTDPLIRNEQEHRQIRAITDFLKMKGYVEAKPKTYKSLEPGEYAVHLNLTVRQGRRDIKLPGDVSIQPRSAKKGAVPLLIEAKSAGDFTNVNKRRKEEAEKVRLLKETYGNPRFVLFLGGYFDSGYLGFEAAEGIDWIWEHRVTDMEKLGL